MPATTGPDRRQALAVILPADRQDSALRPADRTVRPPTERDTCPARALRAPVIRHGGQELSQAAQLPGVRADCAKPGGQNMQHAELDHLHATQLCSRHGRHPRRVGDMPGHPYGGGSASTVASRPPECPAKVASTRWVGATATVSDG